MKFKLPELELELENASVFLRQMADKLDELSQSFFNQEIIITRIRGKIEGDSGVHDDYRAFDARDEFAGGRLYTDEQVKFLVDKMNTLYPRNDGKLTCIHHSFSGGPLHFHVQLATLTRTYEKKLDSEGTSSTQDKH